MLENFRSLRLDVKDISIKLDDLMEILHEDGPSDDNPVVFEAQEVFNLLPHIADIRGGYAVTDNFQRIPTSGEIRIADHIMSCSYKICNLLEGSEYIAVFICTAGQGFTDYSKEYTRKGEYLKAYITDMLGSIVVEKSMTCIQEELEKEMLEKGMKITNRYSPGYCNWPVDDQKLLFSLMPEKVCGITLSTSCMMNPIKTISGILGIGESVKKIRYSCNLCNNKTCVYRIVKSKNIQH